MIPGGKKSNKFNKNPLFLKESRYLKNEITNKCMKLYLFDNFYQ